MRRTIGLLVVFSVMCLMFVGIVSARETLVVSGNFGHWWEDVEAMWNELHPDIELVYHEQQGDWRARMEGVLLRLIGLI